MQPTASDSAPPIVAAVIVGDGKVLLAKRRMREGSLSWQFPAGELVAGETVEHAAARETREEVGLTATPRHVIGERVHPVTGRRMVYVGCEAQAGTAHVADSEELCEIAWCRLGELTGYVPDGVFPPVHDYLRETLKG